MLTQRIKSDFPIFKSYPQLVYLDSTATALKPSRVIRKEREYYTKYSANIFRGIYDLSEKATKEYEKTRTKIKIFVNAWDTKEIVFTRNTTESVNLFVHGIGPRFSTGDSILTSIFEHHSNFVPWQEIAKRQRLRLSIIPQISIDPSDIKKYITKQTKIITLAHVSNVLGSVTPIKELVHEIKKTRPDILFFIDGAQAAPHMKIDVQELGCDGYAFSSHKMVGPTGVGVLWVRKDLLETFAPYQYGGDMIKSVSMQNTVYADLPHRFEAGTPNIAGVIALGEAVSYLESVGLEKIHRHEVLLAKRCLEELKSAFGSELVVLGPKKRESGIVSFTIRGIHSHDVAQLLNEDTIAVRAGHHCAMPLHKHLKVDSSVRASFYLYNSTDDVLHLVRSLLKKTRIFRHR